jgi:hypothetical protein
MHNCGAAAREIRAKSFAAHREIKAGEATDKGGTVIA